MTWQIGDEAVWRSTGFGTTFAQKAKVLKIYKNGNIVFDDDRGQYRPHVSHTGECTASRINGSRFLRGCYVRMTPAVLVEMQEAAAEAELRAMVRKLSEILQHRGTDFTPHREAIAALLDALEPKP